MKHIINNISAAIYLSWHLNARREDFIVLNDLLSVGPLVPVESGVERFIAKRAEFWRTHSFDTSFKASDLSQFIQDVSGASALTLWLSPGSQDQTMWAWLSHIFELYEIDHTKVTIKHLWNKKDSAFPFMSLGELNPSQFDLCEDFKINQENIADLKSSYLALSASSPVELLALLSRSDFSLPVLHECLRSYLKNYPDYKTGLDVFDKALLKSCGDRQSKSARIIGEVLCSDEYDQCVMASDLYLYQKLVSHSQFYSSHPLIELFGNPSKGMRFTEVKITELGKQVLSGEKNKVALNGIDEHVAGVHLSSANDTAKWFYKDGTLINQ